jgi:hypothetical protein
MSTFVRLNTDDTRIEVSSLYINTWDNKLFLTSSNMNTSSDAFQSVPATNQRAFRVEVFEDTAPTANSVSQFAVAYGHKFGSGSLLFNTGVAGRSASRVVYNQYRQLVYGRDTTNFTFGGASFEPNDIIVINVDRSRYKQRLRANSLELKLTNGANTITLISVDNDRTLNELNPNVTQTKSGRQFNIVSGSFTGGISGSNLVQTASGSYGYFYPDSGFMVLNVGALRLANTLNAGTLFNQPNNTTGSLQNAFNIIKNGNQFQLTSEEIISSRYVYLNIRPNDFNYSTNPSYVDEKNKIKFNSFATNPKTFPTTIGLYNDNNELVAVAKLSRPKLKEFTKQYAWTVKLDF